MNIVPQDLAIQHSNSFINSVDHPTCTIVCINCDFPQINNSFFLEKEKLLMSPKIYQTNNYHEITIILKLGANLHSIILSNLSIRQQSIDSREQFNYDKSYKNISLNK